MKGPEKLSRLSIRNKIIAIVFIICAFTLSLGFAFVIVRELEETKVKQRENLLVTSRLICDYCTVPLAFQDEDRGQEVLSRLEYIKEIEGSFVLDTAGDVFAVFPKGFATNHDREYKGSENYYYEKGFIFIEQAINYDDKNYGTLVLKANNDELIQTRKSYILIYIIILLLLLGISYLMAKNLQKMISTPILQLNDHFRRIMKSQDYSVRIESGTRDEIGELYKGFNSMIEKIQGSSEERNKALKELKDSQEKLDLSLEGGDIGTWEWDLQSDLTIWDARMEKLFGLEVGTFKGSYEAFVSCLHPDDIEKTKTAIDRALRDNVPYDISYRAIWKNGEERHIRAKASVTRDHNSTPLKMTGICTDISDLKRAEEELTIHKDSLEDLVRERTAELEQKNVELSDFNELFVGREIRIKELKEELKKLKTEMKRSNNARN